MGRSTLSESFLVSVTSFNLLFQRQYEIKVDLPIHLLL